MKKTAALILNRNMPQLADELGEWLLKQHAAEVDLYVLENGSDVDKHSRHANIILPRSLGPAGGVNEGVRRLKNKGYEYIWVSYNDARFPTTGFLTAALATMEQDPAVALVMPYWPNNIWTYGKRGEHEVVTFSAIISFLVRCSALEKIAHHPGLRLEPVWDSSNFSNHDNVIATLLALYENKLCAITDRHFTVTELVAPAESASVTARGFSDEEWKKIKGPTDVEAWYSRAFPELSGTYKEKRAIIMKKIEQLIRQHRLAVINPVRDTINTWLRRGLNISRALVVKT